MPEQVDPARPPAWLAAMRLQDGVLIEDFACTACGYNLRGLTLEGLCPECGTSVSRSIRGRDLRLADPSWLSGLRWGTALLLVALAVRLPAAVAIDIDADVLGTLLNLALAGLELSAAFLLSAREPAAVLQEDRPMLRWAVRACALLSAGAIVLRVGGPFLRPWVPISVWGFVAVCGVAQHVAMVLCLRNLVRRVDEGAVASTTAKALLILVVSLVVFGLVVLLAALASFLGSPAASTADPFEIVTMIGGCLAGIGVMMVGLWYVWAVYRCHVAFTEALRFARLRASFDRTAPRS